MKTKPTVTQLCLLGALVLQTLTSSAQPIVTRVAAGGAHTLFVESDGSLWAMGDDNVGQLGNFSTNNTYIPEAIVGGPGFLGNTPPVVTAIAARYAHSLFIESDGSLWAMGENQFGQLGTSNFNSSDIPVEIIPSTVTGVAAGADHTLFMESHGSRITGTTELWAMGNNSHGQFGNGTTSSTNVPEKILTFTGITSGRIGAIAAGEEHSLFLKSDNTLWAMGDNSNGQLGDGTTTDSHSPKQVPTTALVTAIGAAYLHSFFIQSDGSLWAMGDNFEGELGNGTSTDIHTPAMIIPTNVTAVAVGNFHTLVIESGGSLWGMGDDNAGELNGIGQNSQLTPLEIVAGGVTAATAGDDFSLFTMSDGSLWGMGVSDDGQLGQNGGFVGGFAGPQQLIGPIVANGGFESHDLLAWVQSNWLAGTNDVSGDPRYAHSGTAGAKMPPPGGAFGTLSQTVHTTPNATYLLSFWLNCDGVTPNQFVASWNGTNLMSQANLPNLGWTNIQFTVPATGSNTVLNFNFTDSAGNFGLDDVSVVQLVQPIITGVSVSGSNLLLNVANGLAGKTYLTLMTTDLTQPVSDWTPVATNFTSTTGNFTITATNAVNVGAPQQFYMLQTTHIIILQ